MVDLLIGYGGGGSNPPTPPIPPVNSETVSSIIDLKAALLDNALDEIIVVDGTYAVQGAAVQGPTSLWIGSAYASRTRPINIRAQTIGGVTFSGSGTQNVGLAFEEGVNSQTWNGFHFANFRPVDTGIILFGGYANLAAAHHITLRNIWMDNTNQDSGAGPNDHHIYFTQALTPGVNNIIIDGYIVAVNAINPIDTAITMYHSTANNPNAHDVTIKNATIVGTYEPIQIWDSTIYNLTIEDTTITNAEAWAIHHEYGTGITLRNVTSISSGTGGLFSANPSAITQINCSLN